MNTYTDLPWKRVWLTGAGSGIGLALAEALCHAGVDVYASGRSLDALNAAKDSLSEQPGAYIPVPLDITDPDQITTLTDQWSQENSWPDLVILNAGTHDPFPAEDFSAERAIALLNTNLNGTLHCLAPVLKHFMQHQHGHIAVMASVAGYRGLPTAAAYGASKAALINLCEALRLDLTGQGVKLQVICPGFVKTPLTDKNTFSMPALLSTQDAAQRIIRGLLTERFEITFPKRFVYWLKLLRILPYSWYFPMVAKATGVERNGKS